MERGHLRVIPFLPTLPLSYMQFVGIPPQLYSTCSGCFFRLFAMACSLDVFWLNRPCVCGLRSLVGVAVGTWGQSGRGVRVCNWFWCDVYRFVVMRNFLVRKFRGTLNHFGSSAFLSYPRELWWSLAMGVPGTVEGHDATWWSWRCVAHLRF